MDDEVVGGGVAREAAVGVALCVGQRHHQARSMHGSRTSVFGEFR
jgi:hypothetical protein